MKIITILGGVLLPAACGDESGGKAGSGSDDSSSTAYSLAAWTLEPGTRIFQATSSCTLRLADDTYRTYLAGITTSTSPDGLTWTALSGVGLVGASGEFLRNPAALRQPDGTILMIYESVTNNTRMRFYRATSLDGAVFTQTPAALASGAVMLPETDENDFISVPDLLRVDEATLRLYFVAGGDHVESAVSRDDGFTWTREGDIVPSGLPPGQWVVDPDAVRLPEGDLRLFFATPPDGVPGLLNKRIRSAISTDGRNFVLEPGDRVGVESGDQDRLDPDVVLLPDGSYRMYFGEATSARGTYDLKSAVSR